eukprot:gb/GEZN01015327.1/.p1 GENE.gb/GEZN01015327.1/~~gb/GEZN01015327.1/.p1  ORF type:complete len:187 (+),score=20.41 gb/GEZN01015327.1/:51-611(+)
MRTLISGEEVASLGASDEDIDRLASCYWFSVEFGFLWEGDEAKAYGAGLLSSFGELEYACSPQRPAGGVSHFPEMLHFDPFVACRKSYPITEYQPTYFIADSMAQVKQSMNQFCESLNRPFHARYDPFTRRIHVDRAVRRLPRKGSTQMTAAKQRAYFEARQKKEQKERRVPKRTTRKTTPLEESI